MKDAFDMFADAMGFGEAFADDMKQEFRKKLWEDVYALQTTPFDAFARKFVSVCTQQTLSALKAIDIDAQDITF
jgi:hypothetical protein